MANSEVSRFNHMAGLNAEYYITSSYKFLCFKALHLHEAYAYILQDNTEELNMVTSEWEGVTKQISKHIKKNIKELENDILLKLEKNQTRNMDKMKKI